MQGDFAFEHHKLTPWHSAIIAGIVLTWSIEQAIKTSDVIHVHRLRLSHEENDSTHAALQQVLLEHGAVRYGNKLRKRQGFRQDQYKTPPLAPSLCRGTRVIHAESSS